MLCIEDLAKVGPVHVAAFVEDQLLEHSKPAVKQRLPALRMLFDWMVVRQIFPLNASHAVRGPKDTQRRVKTRVLQTDEARTLIDAIDLTSLPSLRARPLIGQMVYTFARGRVQLHEKGGKEHEMPTHHNHDHHQRSTSPLPASRKTVRGETGLCLQSHFDPSGGFV